MKLAAWLGVVILTGLVLPGASAQEPVSASTLPAGAVTLSIPSGEKLILELETSLDTRTTKKGERATFKTAADVRVDNRVAIPKGSLVWATITEVKRPGRIKGRAMLRLRFDEVRLPDGTSIPLKASVIRAGLTSVDDVESSEPSLKGEGGSGGSIGSVAQGGMQGAILGVLVAGGKGAAYGSATGAGVALISAILKRGPDLDLPRGTLMEARFDQSTEVPVPAYQAPVQVADNTPVWSREGTPPETAEPEQRERPYLSSRAPRSEAPVWRPEPDSSTVDVVRPPVAPSSSQDGPEVGQASPPLQPVMTKTAPAPPAPAEETPIPSPTAGAAPSPVIADNAGADTASFKLRVDVNTVLVDAVVRDRNGRPMDKLSREDFRIFENGAEQPIRSFSLDELPLAIAIVVDRSGSVARFMGELRDAAIDTLSHLKEGDQVALFSFAGTVERLEDLTTDRRRIANRIAGIRAGGGTDIIDALFDAVYYLSMVAPDRRRAVILVSDNQATTSPRATESQTIRMAMETETVVYSIKTSGDSIPLTMRFPNWIGGKGSVRKVTQETGGEIIDVDTMGSLNAAMAAVVSRLRLRYTLGYDPPASEGTGTFHAIEVRLAEHLGRPGTDYTVNARRGYYSP